MNIKEYKNLTYEEILVLIDDFNNPISYKISEEMKKILDSINPEND